MFATAVSLCSVTGKGSNARRRIPGQSFRLLTENACFEFDDVHGELVAVCAPTQDFTQRLDTGDAAADNDNGCAALSRGELVEPARYPHRIVDETKAKGMLVRALNAKRCPLAAGGNQAGVVGQHEPTFSAGRVAVTVDVRYSVVQESMTITIDALGTWQHDALAAFHAGQYFVNIRRPFEFGARIHNGDIVVAAQPRCRDESGEVAADNDDAWSG